VEEPASGAPTKISQQHVGAAPRENDALRARIVAPRALLLLPALQLAKVFAARSPRSSTPLAEALTAALKLAGKSDKKDFIIVFTDGVPDDRTAAAKVIVDASNKLQSDDELTFLFVQVGHDRAATDYLRDLDDNLKGAKFDIVDAKTVAEAESFASTADLVLAAIDG